MIMLLRVCQMCKKQLFANKFTFSLKSDVSVLCLQIIQGWKKNQ